MSEGEEQKVRLRRMLAEGRGELEWIALISEKGDIIAKAGRNEIEEDVISGLHGIFTIGILPDNIMRVDVLLENGRHIIMTKGKHGFLVCKTRPNPNLGRIYLILRRMRYEGDPFELG
ncbi:MAG: hypothetical protein J7L11_06330 [Thermoprotei archaeon]|nr:hypothetical protein [Thermoprotei archaeon]